MHHQLTDREIAEFWPDMDTPAGREEIRRQWDAMFAEMAADEAEKNRALEVPCLRSLLVLVFRATGADRELDCRIHAYTDGRDFSVETGRGLGRQFVGRRVAPPHDAWWMNHRDSSVPRYTESVDDTIRLIEKLLPGWTYGVSLEPPVLGRTWHAFVNNYDAATASDDLHRGGASYVHGGPSLALLLALLQALLSVQDSATKP